MRRASFTLVELMMVVGILATLVAIALPRVYVMQLRAKQAEAPVMADALGDAAHAYFEAGLGGGAFFDWRPVGVPDRKRHPWPAGVGAAMGFRPEGEVYGQYWVDQYFVPTSPDCDDLGGALLIDGVTVRARTDLDVDGLLGCYAHFEPGKPALVSPPGRY